jgi:hypothetical protein
MIRTNGDRIRKGDGIMERLRVAAGVVVCLVLLAMVVGNAWGDVADRDARLEEVRREIKEKGYTWTADHTAMSELARQGAPMLLGARLPDNYDEILKAIRERGTPGLPMSLPTRFDWTDSAAVSPPRQYLCNACWAAAAVEAMESQLRIHDDDTTRLSVQQCIDCNYEGQTCMSGGYSEDVYDIYMNVGAVSEACYPHTGGDGNCAEDTCPIVAMVDGYEYIDTSIASIKSNLMTYGPIAAGMSVDSSGGDGFMYYSGGCFETSVVVEFNHMILIVGWDDSMCGGEGAWHIKNNFGPDWGESGYAWMKYGTALIGVGSLIIHYTPRERTAIAYESHLIDDSSGNGNGSADPGETVTLEVTLENYRWDIATGLTATLMTSTPGIQVLTSSATFPDIAGGEAQESEAPHFVLSVDPAVTCGRRVHLTVSVEADQGSYSDNFELLVGGSAATVFADDVEADTGWSLAAPDDDASSGLWVRVDPKGSVENVPGDTWYVRLIQPELDHTPDSGFQAFVTGNTGRRWPPERKDVDGGKTTLMTPLFDLSGKASAAVKYWKWYMNEALDVTVDDVWMVDVSADSGQTWVNLETQETSYREWLAYDFDLGDYIPLTDQVVMRFVASDYGELSTVEAAVDDFELTGCPASVDVLAPYVEVLSPNGGEELTEETEVQVDWALSDDYGFRDVIVLASYDGGATYDDTLGVMTGFDSNLMWQVPAGDHPSCKIGVEATDRGYNTSFDESDSLFAIVRDPAGIDDFIDESIPEGVILVGTERNPFSGSTHILFGLPSEMETTLRVYDARGRLIRELINSGVTSGYHSVVWDGRATSGRRAASGVYFLRLMAGGTARTAKVMVVR